ncbi:hypothetical protein CRG98_005487 [Punica granatum]|uniref:Uncharacterized protein n=1 Tax=Punica granatum TaxID=22663 RepID=A0A2I0L060_PUNGR|nr:hypothetical protein CRG98_005487 [Punica granatum]
MALVVLGCVQVRSRVPFARPWIGPPGALLEKASVRVRGCPGLSRMPLKRARTCRSPWKAVKCQVCALEFNLVGARMREAYATRLGSIHRPGDARRAHVRRSRHLPFYDPKVEGRQVTRV